MCLSHTHAAVAAKLTGADAPGAAPTEAEQAPRWPAEAGRRAGHDLSRRNALKLGGAAATAALWPTPALASPRLRRPPKPWRLRDLSHTFSTDFPVFSDSERATRETVVTIPDDGYYLQRWTFYEHTATHVDAPGHFAPGGRLSPELRPDELVTPVVVIDISERAARDPDAEVTVADLRRYERRYRRIPRRAAVCMFSGWEYKADDEEAYRGTDASGTYHFPGFGVEAVEWLLERRHAKSIGVDTLSLDPGKSADFAVHVRWLGADKYGMENLRNLATIPPEGAWIFVGLVPWEEGSGGPCRVLASW